MIGIITIGIVVVFVIILIFTYVYKSIENSNKVYPWPPHISKCPEYWEVSKTNTNKCKSTKDINRASGYMKNTEVNAFNQDTDLKEFRKEADAARSTAYKYWNGVLLN